MKQAALSRNKFNKNVTLSWKQVNHLDFLVFILLVNESSVVFRYYSFHENINSVNVNIYNVLSLAQVIILEMKMAWVD